MALLLLRMPEREGNLLSSFSFFFSPPKKKKALCHPHGLCSLYFFVHSKNKKRKPNITHPSRSGTIDDLSHPATPTFVHLTQISKTGSFIQEPVHLLRDICEDPISELIIHGILFRLTQ